MSLSLGDRLGPYEILALIGKGGMGEVYRARDPRLNRDVAIKISAAQFTERFEREAKAIAALNHPNICQIYDVGPNYLVMEYIDGESPTGPMPLDEAMRIGRQIAEALEAAHERGITHRDLKPGNIRIKPDGTVKVLDFGLAKVTAVASGSGENSPTLTIGMTQAGMILGTAAYMAPEQASGKENIDKRADIWAFGVVLYELLTGKHLFTGETVGEILASVIKERPNLDEVPQQARPLLEHCLEKNPKKRLRDIGDIELLLAEPPARLAQPPPVFWAKWWLPWSIAAFLLLALMPANIFHLREASLPEQPLRASIPLPENSSVHSFAISPDGRTLVIAAAVNGKRQLWLRPMDAPEAQPMPFTDDAIYPFWSPDSRYIGFFAQERLKKIASSGGPAHALCEAPSGSGGSWSRDDVIVFSSGITGTSIQRVAGAGGVPAEVLKTGGERWHPVFLPDGHHFLTATTAMADQNGVYVSSLDGKENRKVLTDVSSVIFAPSARSDRTGHILFVRQNVMMAAPFDAGRAQVLGDAFPVAEGVSLTAGLYLPATISNDGVLLYQTGINGGTNQIGWYDRSGKFLGPVSAPGTVLTPALSPDEKSVAFRRSTGKGSDIWLRNLGRGTETRFTSVAGSFAPSWSPKGDRIVFNSARRGGYYNLYQKATSGSEQDELLLLSRAE